MHSFSEVHPSTENYWRAIILFGRNVASYKFALGKSLIELAERDKTSVTLEELAEPFSRHLCEHLQVSDKQVTSSSSRFLDTCRQFNAGEVSKEALLDATVKLGFNNVIDAFHVVNQSEVSVRFFMDERKSRTKGIELTDTLHQLRDLYQWQNLAQEVEARWRLVETAWALNLPYHLLTVRYDADIASFVANRSDLERTPITAARDALNGYQKGKCFYCFRDVSVLVGSEDLADVDHVFPHVLKRWNVVHPIDGVWNLVLACRSCNRGEAGKAARAPARRYVKRLSRRNDFLIDSHHPLRETLLAQTGSTLEARRAFLQRAYSEAVTFLINTWHSPFEEEPAF